MFWCVPIICAGQQPTPALPERGANPEQQFRPTYVLGSNDQILIRAFEVEEISDKPFRIDSEGFVTLPLLGKVKAGGLTVQELEAELLKRLKVYVREPQVAVTLVQFRSEPIFFVGAFKSPGIYPLQGRRTLVEMLTTVGGLQANASRRIKITRRFDSGPIPLPGVIEDPDRKVNTVEISMGSLRDNVNPAEDIALQPYDVVTVERAEMVYISGLVNKVGAFELGERESLSIAQAVTLAGGLNKEADSSKARILRPVLDTNRRSEIPVNIRKIMAGQANDYPLLPNDVLYVPPSRSRSMWKFAGLAGGTLLPILIYLALR